MNIFVLDRNYKKIGVLSNQGVNPKAPYFDDLYTQELDTGADTYYFSTLATYYAQDIIEIGNHVVFEFNNKQKMFVISSLEFEHKDGMNVIGVYAEGAGFELLEKYKKDIKIEGCTYAQLLDNILAGTGWKYKVSSSLAKETRDVDFTQEKNVYALLQDSMQTFQGVELEFITDYRDGSPVKTIRAYGNGERGTFVGKRFEYGKNVKGIVKTQEVSNVKDEDVIFNEGLIVIDGLRVEVTYDVDFALRSEEVADLNIGDTHYIIDNDFNPPMNIKGRIGKIEISFSDPTRNKVYLANFKKATGSKSDKTKEEDVKDIIDDYLDDKYGDGDNPADHDHGRLVYDDNITHSEMYYESTQLFEGIPGEEDFAPIGEYLYRLTTENASVNLSVCTDDLEDPDWVGLTIHRENSMADHDYMIARIFTSAGDMNPNFDNHHNIGILNRRWKEAWINNIYANYINANYIEANTVSSGRYYGYNYQVRFDRDDMQNVTQVTDKQDLLDFIINDINIYKYSSKKIDDIVGAPDEFPYQEYYGLLAEDFTTHNSDTDCGGSEVAYNIIKNLVTDDTNNDGDQTQTDGHNKHTYNIPALITALIGAFQQHVKNGGDIDLSKYATYDDLDEWGSNLDLAIREIYQYIDKKIAEVEAETGASIEDIFIQQHSTVNGLEYHLIFTFSDNSTIDAGVLPKGDKGDPGLGIDRVELTEDNHLYVYYTSGGYQDVGVITVNSSGGGTIPEGDTISVKKIVGGNPAYGEIMKYVEFEDAIMVKQINSPDGYLDYNCEIDIAGGVTAGGDVVVGGDLYVYGSIISENGSSSGGGSGNSSMLNGKIKYVEKSSDPDFPYPCVQINDTLQVTGNLLVEGDTVHFDDISAECVYGYLAVFTEELHCETISTTDANTKTITIEKPITVNGYVYCTDVVKQSDKSLKENIRYIDNILTRSDDLLDKADLHDFIVNQVNLCEYNFIGDDSDKIGFIANDYEGTKIGDKIVSRYDDTLVYNESNLLFATIGALQEEVRIKDEKIASLEARLAKIEEMLGINNN